MKTRNFTLKERNKTTTTIFQLRKKMEQFSIDTEENSDDDSVQEYLMKKLDKTSGELDKIENEYTQGLAIKTISRCPFSDEPFSLSIDTFGLDGPWWDANQPIRASEEESNTFFALTGCVSIVGEPPEAPFSIKPGPALPWVSPRLLADENIIAVISHIKIGLFDAYPIVYYSKNKTVEIERINTWGTEEYFAEDVDGFAIMGSTFDDEEEYDFDIAPWVEKGKLKWIAIDDESLVLHDTIDGCPYLNLSGYRYPVLIQNKTLIDCMIILEYEDEEVSDNNANSYETSNYDVSDYKVPEIGKSKKATNFCSNCGSTLKENAKFCSNCGYKLN